MQTEKGQSIEDACMAVIETEDLKNQYHQMDRRISHSKKQ